METRIELKQGWKILQDVHDTGEKIGLYAAREADTSVGSQVSEWEELEELKHLQLIYARQPYFGRELRYFNQAPWWYKTEFEVPDQKVTDAVLKFTNVDYYGKNFGCIYPDSVTFPISSNSLVRGRYEIEFQVPIMDELGQFVPGSGLGARTAELKFYNLKKLNDSSNVPTYETSYLLKSIEDAEASC